MAEVTRKTVLISGANRGIGLALTTRFLSDGHTVYAAMRNPDGAREAWELERDYPGRCHIVQLDVTSHADIERLASTMSGVTLDILINNAGVLPQQKGPWTEVSPDDMLLGFKVNVMAPLRLTQTLWPNLARSKQPTIANISSKMGSIADNQSGGMHAYRISKTALNMLTKGLSQDLKGAICVALHPGWVATEMGGPGAPTSVEESAAGLASVIQKLTPKDSGSFLDFRGAELPW